VKTGCKVQKSPFLGMWGCDWVRGVKLRAAVNMMTEFSKQAHQKHPVRKFGARLRRHTCWSWGKTPVRRVTTPVSRTRAFRWYCLRARTTDS